MAPDHPAVERASVPADDPTAVMAGRSSCLAPLVLAAVATAPRPTTEARWWRVMPAAGARSSPGWRVLDVVAVADPSP